ncbi:MAG: hypothetical protein JXQ29_15760, partial [Planctomycetes bacterium]|nr:hypothetical protein [Planctomycetota bacterium]
LNAYLDDHVFLAHGLLDLHEATGEAVWRDEADALLGVVLARFADRRDGGFYFTSDDHEPLLTRSKNPFDQAIPSGNGVAALVLLRLARLTGKRDYVRLAARSFHAFGGILERAPRASESLLLALAQYHDRFTAEERREAERPDAAGQTRVARGPVTVAVSCAASDVAAGDAVAIELRLAIEPGWRLDETGGEPGGRLPIRIRLDTQDAVLGEVRRAAFETAPVRPEPGAPPTASEQTLLLTAAVQIAPDAKPGRLGLPFRVTFQACDDRQCLAAETVSLALEVIVRGEGVRE